MRMKDGRRKFSEEEILKLIRFIEKKPELYNLSSDRSIQHCNEIWNEIAEKMKIKHVTGDLLKWKWKNVRDTYKRLKRNNCPTRWRFYQDMSFLDKVYDPDNAQSNDEKGSEDDVGDEGEEEASKVDECQTADDNLTETINSILNSAKLRRHSRSRSPSPTTSADVTTSTASAAKRQKLNPLPTPVGTVSVISNPVDNNMDHSIVKVEDEDDMYFLSCGRRVRKLSKRNQAWVKFKLSELIYEAETAEIMT